MRYLIALAPLALLAACGGNKAANNSAGNNASANAAAPAPAAPPVTMAPPGPGPVSDAPAAMAARAQMIGECTSDAPPNLPAGTDLNALCGCAVDRVMAGAERRESIQGCASEMGVALPPTK